MQHLSYDRWFAALKIYGTTPYARLLSWLTASSPPQYRQLSRSSKSVCGKKKIYFVSSSANKKSCSAEKHFDHQFQHVEAARN